MMEYPIPRRCPNCLKPVKDEDEHYFDYEPDSGRVGYYTCSDATGEMRGYFAGLCMVAHRQLADVVFDAKYSWYWEMDK